MSEHQRCDDVTCPTCSGLPEVQPEPPTVHWKPYGRKEEIGADGALYRVHLFCVVDEDGKIMTDTTVNGEKPILVQGVPMQITHPTIVRRASGMVMH